MKKSFIAIACILCVLAYAKSVTVPMYLTATSTSPAASVGTIVAEDTKYGLMLTPHLQGLSPTLAPGAHGFHVHVNPSCANGGMAAGGHLDPSKINHHLGPYANGHLGDLPALAVDAQGNATVPVVAPRLKLKDILNRSLMIHQGGDNYSDNPPMGGGGARMVCGVIPAKAS